MEIERKYLIHTLPENYETFPYRQLEQGYLCKEPVVRIRQDNDNYELTYKSKGLLAREEHNMPLTKEAYEHLRKKIDGKLITKKRYMIPYGEYMIELDVFEGALAPLKFAEVEFNSIEEAENFNAPDWFGEDVTFEAKYKNSNLILFSKSCHFRDSFFSILA